MPFQESPHLRLALGLALIASAAACPWAFDWYRSNVGLVITVALIVVGAFVAIGARRQILVTGTFGGRQPLSAKQIYSQFYSPDPLGESEFEYWWCKVSRVLKISPELLRPTDRLGIEVRGSWSIDNEIDDLEWLCRANIPDFATLYGDRPLETIDEVVRALAAAGRDCSGGNRSTSS